MDALAESGYDVLVIDQTRSLLGDEEYDSAADVARLKGTTGVSGEPKVVLCYWDVGEAESYRWYWEDDWDVGDPEWIVAPDPDGWDENYPVAFWDEEWRGIMLENLDRIQDDGYDGVYLDWLEVYEFRPVAEMAEEQGLDPADELTAFVEDLARHARSRDPGFLCVAQNAAEMGQDADYRGLFDGIAQEAIWFDGVGDPDAPEQTEDMAIPEELTDEYLEALACWRDAGKPVFDVEYATDEENAAEAYRLGEEHGFLTYVTTRPLDRLSETPPLGQ